MSRAIYVMPSREGDVFDVVSFDPSDNHSRAILHYAYAVGADRDALDRRAIPWRRLRLFDEAFAARHASWLDRMRSGSPYIPGELTLQIADRLDANSQLNTILRLGALEVIANISSGRLAATDKDPFPHQLALQQFMNRVAPLPGLRRVLIADEVGLGKTIEAGLILRDILVARGTLENFCCLYLTAGGLVHDAAEKLRSVLSGTFEGRNLVDTVTSFREFGEGNINGVFVASMHAARRYVTDNAKNALPTARVAPDVLIIDECHHASSHAALGGTDDVLKADATQTYKAAFQLLSGQYWANSEAPKLALMMSATPFRSQRQFVNLVRLLTHGVCQGDGDPIDAYHDDAGIPRMHEMLRAQNAPVYVAWRRQEDEQVRAWSGARLFPSLTVRRPHRDEDPDGEAALRHPGEPFLSLMRFIKEKVRTISRAHSTTFGGFASAQLEKKLTSSSIAGACWIFSWCVRRTHWSTRDQFRSNNSKGAEALRQVIREISQRLAAFNPLAHARHATVRFPSERFEFAAASLSHEGRVGAIYDYWKRLKKYYGDPPFILSDRELTLMCEAARQLIRDDAKGNGGAAENAKLDWLREILKFHERDKFLVFTESLQTCEVVTAALGTQCRQLIGAMGDAERRREVAEFRMHNHVRVLIATSAADEGFDLQVANRIVHWDLSSSPATIMQRNGRVARLGQRSDVTAYYLILPGTHEEQRDTRLRETFANLGIDDESMRNRILGSLNEEELEQLEEAVAAADEGIVGELLRQAQTDNEEMSRQLAAVRTELAHRSVLGRTDLLERMEMWSQLGLPETDVEFELEKVTWQRPVFDDPAGVVASESKRARLRRERERTRQHVVFDPEFLVFGPDVPRLTLAGLRPWIATSVDPEVLEVRPDAREDFLGDLMHQLARLPADLGWLPRTMFTARCPEYDGANYLLFCTHPLREDEVSPGGRNRPYLTFYPIRYADGAVRTLTDAGGTAEEVHDVIAMLEENCARRANRGLGEAETAQAKEVGRRLAEWLQSVTKFGATAFLGPQEYFVPIPVALVALVEA